MAVASGRWLTFLDGIVWLVCLDWKLVVKRVVWIERRENIGEKVRNGTTALCVKHRDYSYVQTSPHLT